MPAPFVDEDNKRLNGLCGTRRNLAWLGVLQTRKLTLIMVENGCLKPSKFITNCNFCFLFLDVTLI